MAGTPLTRETVENTPTGAVEFDPSLLIGEDEETPVEVPTDPIVGAMGDEGAQAIAAYFQTHPEDAPTDEAWQAQFGQHTGKPKAVDQSKTKSNHPAPVGHHGPQVVRCRQHHRKGDGRLHQARR